MVNDLRIRYSESLHDGAARWGLPVLPGRPLIGLPPASREKGIIGNPYPPGDTPIPDYEVISLDTRPGRRNEIRIFTFNGRWGYSLTLTYRQGEMCGMGYGSFLKHCDPYPTKQAAIVAAAHEILRRVREDQKIIGWAKSLIVPQQISLF